MHKTSIFFCAGNMPAAFTNRIHMTSAGWSKLTLLELLNQHTVYQMDRWWLWNIHFVTENSCSFFCCYLIDMHLADNTINIYVFCMDFLCCFRSSSNRYVNLAIGLVCFVIIYTAFLNRCGLAVLFEFDHTITSIL